MNLLISNYKAQRRYFSLYQSETNFTISSDKNSQNAVDVKGVFWELPAEVQFPVFFDIAIRNPQYAIETAGFSYQFALAILLFVFALSSFV